MRKREGFLKGDYGYACACVCASLIRHFSGMIFVFVGIHNYTFFVTNYDDDDEEDDDDDDE